MKGGNLLTLTQASVREVLNSSVTSDNDDEDDGKHVNGISRRDSRSVSSTLHDRARTANQSGNLSPASTPADRAFKDNRSQRRTGSHSTPTGSNPGPAGVGAARETFMNYFFGTQGPASAPSTAIPPSGLRSQINTHTDILGGEPLPEQDMGKVAALDMKSLGKHLESVSEDTRAYGAFFLFAFVDPSRLSRLAHSTRRNGNNTYPLLDQVILWHRSTVDTRSRTQGNYALPCEQYISASSEPTCQFALQTRNVLGTIARGRNAGCRAGESQGIA